MVLCRGLHGYFEDGGVVLLIEWCGPSKRVWYFEEGGVRQWLVICF